MTATVTSREAARRLGVSLKGICSARRRGRLMRVSHSIGSHDLYLASDVELYGETRWIHLNGRRRAVLALCLFLGRFG